MIDDSKNTSKENFNLSRVFTTLALRSYFCCFNETVKFCANDKNGFVYEMKNSSLNQNIPMTEEWFSVGKRLNNCRSYTILSGIDS